MQSCCHRGNAWWHNFSAKPVQTFWRLSSHEYSGYRAQLKVVALAVEAAGATLHDKSANRHTVWCSERVFHRSEEPQRDAAKASDRPDMMLRFQTHTAVCKHVRENDAYSYMNATAQPHALALQLVVSHVLPPHAHVLQPRQFPTVIATGDACLLTRYEVQRCLQHSYSPIADLEI